MVSIDEELEAAEAAKAATTKCEFGRVSLSEPSQKSVGPKRN